MIKIYMQMVENIKICAILEIDVFKYEKHLNQTRRKYEDSL
jgi:hypothetical protein